MDNEKLVKTIRNICKEHNISVSQLEKELNFGAGLISRWVKNSPSLDKIVNIADYFCVSLDEVIGRNYPDNEFINKLIRETQNKSIKWNVYDNSIYEPKQYHGEKSSKKNGKRIMTVSDIDYYTFHFKEISYYSVFDNAYISIYSQYDDDKITSPNVIKLFIQPAIDAQLIEQDFSCNELLILWIKVLYNIDGSPDKIKAEEFKNAFVLNKSLINGNDVLAGGLNDKPETEILTKVANDPAVQQFMELCRKPEFQKMQQVVTSPEFQAAIEATNKIKHLNGEGK